LYGDSIPGSVDRLVVFGRRQLMARPASGTGSEPSRGHPSGLRRLIATIGPGLITGAADDDPSGIATYVQTGAQFGYSQLWTALFVLPLLTAVQEASARVGAVTGRGLAAVMRDRYGVCVVYLRFTRVRGGV
jgi:Mn2+/Fe2+ NRAMP family transporter